MHHPSHSAPKIAGPGPAGHNLEKQVQAFLARVPRNSAWGFAAADFLEHIDSKTPPDYRELLRELLEDMQEGPQTMKKVLGTGYRSVSRMLR